MYNDGADGNSSGFLTNNDLNFAPSRNTVLQVTGERVELPDAQYVRDADLSRDGMDLVLTAPDGSTVVIEGYFAAVPAPLLFAPDGTALTPQLVNSFIAQPLQYAEAGAGAATDESPVGAVKEVSGNATVTRLDGTVETIQIGTPIFQGDVVETDSSGAVNIAFLDETTFAVSEDARLAIDEYVYDPSTQSGSTNFSVLKGVFVFTSGMIGREDPDDVQIETPVGSIGIRGTIIAGNVNTGEITVVEGAIVLKDFAGNEMTLAMQFETARFDASANQIENLGQKQATQVLSDFRSIAPVSPQLFTSIGDSARESGNSTNNAASPGGPQGSEQQNAPAPQDQNNQNQQTQEPARDGQQGNAGQAAPVQNADNQQAQTTPATTSSGLGGDSSGLSGNNSGLSTGSQSAANGSGSSASQAGSGTNASAGSSGTAGSAPAPAPAPANPATQAQAAAAANQPPPQVIQQQANNNSGTGNTPPANTAPPATTPPATTPDPVTPTTPANQAPTALTLSHNAVIESVATGAAIGTFATADPDAGDSFTYSLVNDPDDKFIIVGNELRVNGPLDYETVTSHSITVRTTDAGGLTYDQTFTINVTNDPADDFVNTPPTGADDIITATEDTAYTFSADDFGFDDADAGQSLKAVRIDSLPSQGTLYLNGIPVLAAGQIILLADIPSLTYSPAPDANGAAYTTLSFSVQDTQGGWSVAQNTLTFDVMAVNDGPSIITNTGVTVEEGAAVTITNAMLHGEDVDDAPGDLTYTITTMPANGEIRLNGIALGVNGTFTQDDINQGRVSFWHDGSETLGDSFEVSLQDGGEDGAAAITALVDITVTPDNELMGTSADDIFMPMDGDMIEIYNGDGGHDTYNASNLTDGINVNLATNKVTYYDGVKTDTLISIEEIIGTDHNDTFYAASSYDNVILIDGGDGQDTYNAQAVGNNITLNLQNNKVSVAGDTNKIYNFETFLLGDGSDTVIAGDLVENITIDGGFGSDTFDASGLTGSVTYNAADGTITDGSGLAYTLENFETIIGNGGTLNFADGPGVEFNGNMFRLNGTAEWIAFSNFAQITGSSLNDTITISETQDVVINGGQGNDVFLVGVDSSYENTLFSVDGHKIELYGGEGEDTLAFTSTNNGNTYYINADGTEDTIEGVEVFDFLSNNAADIINFSVNDEMFANYLSGDKITLRVSNTDTLKLDFTAYNDTPGFFMKLSGGEYGDNFIEYRHSSGDTIRVERDYNGAAWNNVITNGLVDLNLNMPGDGFHIITNDSGTGFGGLMVAPGDHDYDGYDDLMVGRWDSDIISYFGNPYNAFTGTSNIFVETGSDLGISGSMTSLSFIGDFNGDGVADFIAGFGQHDSGKGAAVIFDAGGDVLHTIYGTAPGQNFGQMVMGAGDIDGDGYNDIIINSQGLGSGPKIIYGGDDVTPRQEVLSNAPTNGFVDIGAIGDFNGDGKADIVFTNSETGIATIAYGGQLGAPLTYTVFNNIAVDANKSMNVLSLGDINGDGKNDIAITAGGANGGKGYLHIVYGGSVAQGETRNINTHTTNPAKGFTLQTDTDALAASLIGGGAVGDFNGDGIDDIALVFKREGQDERDVDIFVLYGKDHNDPSSAMYDGVVTMQELYDSANAFHMGYTIPGSITDADDFDFEIAAAGDINGDGLADIAIGTPSGNDGGGQVILVYGQTSPDVNVIMDGSPEGNDHLFAGAAGQTMIGGEGDDVLEQGSPLNSNLVMLGGQGEDEFIISATNFKQIDGGADVDIVTFTDNADLSAFTGNDISRVEILHMDTSSKTMKVSLQTLMDMAASSDAGILIIQENFGGNNNLVIDTNHTGDSQITGGSANNAGQVKLALEDVFGDSNVQHETRNESGTTYEDFTIGGHTISIASSLIDTIVIADVP